jgi:sec-independent protein translocase protein TatB
MFEIGWTEMLVIAVVMIVVVGPKDLPKMLRTFGKTTAKLRSMAGDFQKQFNEALKEAELDDVKKSVDALKSLNPATEIKKQLNPFEKAAADVRSGLDTLKPKPPEPASPVAHPAEPLKNGAAVLPGEGAAAASTPAPAAALSTPVPPVAAAPIAVNAVAVAPKAAKPRAPRARKPVDPDAPAKPRAPRKKKPESSAS